MRASCFNFNNGSRVVAFAVNIRIALLTRLSLKRSWTIVAAAKYNLSMSPIITEAVSYINTVVRVVVQGIYYIVPAYAQNHFGTVV